MTLRRMVMWIAVAAWLPGMAALSGCREKPKVHRYESSEEIRESEPVMVSPGEEVLE